MDSPQPPDHFPFHSMYKSGEFVRMYAFANERDANQFYGMVTLIKDTARLTERLLIQQDAYDNPEMSDFEALFKLIEMFQEKWGESALPPDIQCSFVAIQEKMGLPVTYPEWAGKSDYSEKEREAKAAADKENSTEEKNTSSTADHST